MPALVVDTTPCPASSASSASSPPLEKQRGSDSPARPPVSPITPTSSVVQLAPVASTDAQPRPAPPPEAVFRPQPASVAISESENPDAIALRSAISLLQLQREKSKRDLKALQELKAAAVSDPQAFARSLYEQRAQASQTYTDTLTPTLSGLVDANLTGAEAEANVSSAKIPAVPQPQNIVRCPPVNWAKYHVVGEPLNKMHEEQNKWPGATDPPQSKSGVRGPPHAVTAPYSPFTDGLHQSPLAPQPSKNAKKPPS